MAAIGSIRKQSTLLLIVVAIALLAFILGDFSRKSNQAKAYEKFVIVGKEYISYDKFMDVLNVRKEQVKERAERSLTPEEEFQVNEQVYNEIVDSILFAIQKNYLGVTVTPEELFDLVAGSYPHQYAAQFFTQDGINHDMNIARQFLENMDQYDSNAVSTYLMLENAIERETLLTKYLNLLTKAYYIPKAFAKKTQEESSWRADLEIVQIPYSSPLVTDDKVSVNDDDLNKWYNANKFRFRQESEVRAVDYVIFNIEPSEADLKEIEGNVVEMFEEFTQTDDPKAFVNRMVDTRFDSTFHRAGQLPLAIDTALFFAPVGSFVEPYIDGDMWTFAKLLAAETRPDSVNISFIIVADYGLQQDVRRKKEESEQIWDSAYQAVMSGVDFYEVAARFSDYPITQMPDSGRLWLVDGVSPYIFGSNIFDTIYPFNTGTIIKREIEGATLLVKLHEKTAAERKIQVAVGKKAIVPSEETIENIESAVNTFSNGVDDYQKFNDAVIKHNLNKRSFDRAERMTFALPGTGGNGSREIVRWIYDEKIEIGNVSQFSLENMHVVVVLKDIHKEGYRPLENAQVREYVEMMAKRDKKAEILEDILKKSLSGNRTITQLAEEHQTMVDSSTISFADRNLSRFGPEGKVIGKIFGQKEGTDVYRGDMGVYAIKINKFDMPTIDIASDEHNDMFIQQNTMMYQNRVFSGSAKALKKMYKIEDNRYTIF